MKECREGHGSLFEIRNLENEPYSPGYVPWPDALDSTSREAWPPHTGPYDDVSYCLGTEWVPYPQAATPDIPELIVKRLVLSHMMALADYLKSVIANLEYSLRRIPGHIGDIDFTIESILVEILHWNCRLSEYCGYIEDVLDQLRLLPDPEIKVPVAVNGYSSINDEFHYVHEKLINLRKRTQELNLLGGSLRDVLEAEDSSLPELWSRQEGRAVIALTFVGIVFLPLLFVAELFSMGQNFGPGELYFWVYWIVAIPSSCLLLMAWWLFVRKARTVRVI